MTKAGRTTIQVDQARLRNTVRHAVLDLPFGQTGHFRLEPVSRDEYGAGGVDRVAFTFGGNEAAFGVRLVECAAGEPASVALTGFHSAVSFAATWATFLWEEWVKRQAQQPGSAPERRRGAAPGPIPSLEATR